MKFELYTSYKNYYNYTLYIFCYLKELFILDKHKNCNYNRIFSTNKIINMEAIRYNQDLNVLVLKVINFI